MSSFKAIVAFGLLATAQLVASHGVITDATGDAGGSGSKQPQLTLPLLLSSN